MFKEMKERPWGYLITALFMGVVVFVLMTIGDAEVLENVESADSTAVESLTKETETEVDYTESDLEVIGMVNDVEIQRFEIAEALDSSEFQLVEDYVNLMLFNAFFADIEIQQDSLRLTFGISNKKNLNIYLYRMNVNKD